MGTYKAIMDQVERLFPAWEENASCIKKTFRRLGTKTEAALCIFYLARRIQTLLVINHFTALDIYRRLFLPRKCYSECYLGITIKGCENKRKKDLMDRFCVIGREYAFIAAHGKMARAEARRQIRSSLTDIQQIGKYLSKSFFLGRIEEKTGPFIPSLLSLLFCSQIVEGHLIPSARRTYVDQATSSAVISTKLK